MTDGDPTMLYGDGTIQGLTAALLVDGSVPMARRLFARARSR